MANLPYVGMPSDEVLKMHGREEPTNWPSRVIGSRDEEGSLTVRWEYPDIVLILRHWNGRYRVAEIVQNVEGAEDDKE